MKQNTSTPWYQEADARERERDSWRGRERNKKTGDHLLWQRARLKNLKSLKPFREVRSSVSPQEHGMVEVVNGFGKLKKEKKMN